MEDGLKQRLIGAIVLIALAVIFLPAILDGKKQVQTKSEAVVVPDRPKFEVIAPIVKSQESEKQAIRETIAQDRQQNGEDDIAALQRDMELLNTVEIPQQEEVVAVDESTTEAAETEIKQTMTPPETSEGLTPVWTIQLASFSQTANANQLKEKLLADQFRAYTETVSAKSGTITRVFVGPEMTKKRAETVKGELKKRYDLNGLIVKFVP